MRELQIYWEFLLPFRAWWGSWKRLSIFCPKRNFSKLSLKHSDLFSKFFWSFCNTKHSRDGKSVASIIHREIECQVGWFNYQKSFMEITSAPSKEGEVSNTLGALGITGVCHEIDFIIARLTLTLVFAAPRSHASSSWSWLLVANSRELQDHSFMSLPDEAIGHGVQRIRWRGLRVLESDSISSVVDPSKDCGRGIHCASKRALVSRLSVVIFWIRALKLGCT